MADKLMYIPSNDTQNYHFGKLILLVEKFSPVCSNDYGIGKYSPIKPLNRLSSPIRKVSHRSKFQFWMVLNYLTAPPLLDAGSAAAISSTWNI